MSTLSGKPANPIDLSGYASRRPGEGGGGERHPLEDDRDAFRSPYAPKEPWRRAAAKTDPEAVSHDTTTNAAPLAPHEESGSGWPSADEQASRDHSTRAACDE